MSAIWNQIPANQQNKFLQAAGLEGLPEPSALNSAQWKVLEGIVGEEVVNNLRKQSGGAVNPADPRLEMPTADVGDWSSIMAMVAELQAKLGELQIKVSQEGIQTQKDNIEEAHKKEMERLKENLEKLQKANKSGLFAKVFGWIGTVVGIIGAAIATVATGGAAAPALALAIVGVVMMALQESGAMEKIVDFLADNPKMLMAILGPVIGGVLCGLIEGGVIPEDQVKMAIQITVSVAMLIASIASMVCSGGAAASDVVFKVVGMVGQIVGSLASVGSGAAGIAESAYTYQADTAIADAKELQAWLARLQQMLSEETDFLQEVIEKLNAGVVDASEVLAGIAQSNQSVISNMGM